MLMSPYYNLLHACCIYIGIFEDSVSNFSILYNLGLQGATLDWKVICELLFTIIDNS